MISTLNTRTGIAAPRLRAELTEQDPHGPGYSAGVFVQDGCEAATLRAANSSAVLICSRVIGYCSMIFAAVMPASRLEKRGKLAFAFL